MHFSTLFTTGLLASVAVAAPALPGKTKPAPTSTEAPTRCSTDPGTSTVVATVFETSYVEASTCGPDKGDATMHPATLPHTTETTTRETDSIATPGPSTSDPCAPTVIKTRTDTQTFTSTTTTACPGPTGTQACDASVWVVTGAEFEPVPANWWSFSDGTSLQHSIDHTRHSPWSGQDWEWYAWHVSPTGQDHASSTNTSSQATAQVCLAPGHNYRLIITLGGVEGQIPHDATISATVAGNKFFDYKLACPTDEYYTCTEKYWYMFTNDGQQILTKDHAIDLPIGGTQIPDDNTTGFLETLKIKVNYPSDVAAAASDYGLYVVRVTMQKL